MAPRKKPVPMQFVFKAQPEDHQDIIDAIEQVPKESRSHYLRAAVRLAKEHPELLKKFLDNPTSPQLALKFDSAS